MSEEKKQQNTSTKEAPKAEEKKVFKSVYGGRNVRRNGPRQERKDEFDQRILDLARVTRVMGGGKRMRFRACVAVGDKKGKIGIGLGKGTDVALAVNKAVSRAKKVMINVPIAKDTIPHEVYHKFGAAKILFKPAKKGKGVIAGSVVRIVLELAGVKNITSKILGTTNKVSNAKCTVQALQSLRKVESKSVKVVTKKKDEKVSQKKVEKK